MHCHSNSLSDNANTYHDLDDLFSGHLAAPSACQACTPYTLWNLSIDARSSHLKVLD